MVTSAQIAALLNGTIDLVFLRDGDPTEGIRMSTLFRERYVAVLPAAHSLARKRALRVKDLREVPFILFARRMGPPGFRQNHRLLRKKRIPPQHLSRIRRNGRLWYA